MKQFLQVFQILPDVQRWLDAHMVGSSYRILAAFLFSNPYDLYNKEQVPRNVLSSSHPDSHSYSIVM